MVLRAGMLAGLGYVQSEMLQYVLGAAKESQTKIRLHLVLSPQPMFSAAAFPSYYSPTDALF